MANDYFIQAYSHIRNNQIWHNGESIFTADSADFSSFMKAAYKHFALDYGKFFKMDSLSKLAFMASNPLLNDEPEKNTALVMTNKAGSLDTDRKHQTTMNDYPSPAVFVYTLPNICLGEISIKHQLYSENAFFVFDSFNPSTLHDYANALLDSKKAEKVLCGWVDFEHQKHDAFLYIVSKSGTFEHSLETLNRLYQTP